MHADRADRVDLREPAELGLLKGGEFRFVFEHCLGRAEALQDASAFGEHLRTDALVIGGDH